jgi:hypothetical protein
MKMKQNSIQKVLILLVVGIGICFPCFSQQCVSDTLVTYPAGDITYVGYGFIDVNNLPCISSGSYSELVIPFKTYNQGARLLTLQDSSTVPISKIYRIKIESVENLPIGLCWAIRPSSLVISGGEVGAVIIKGTTSVSAGLYPVSVKISIDTKGDGTYAYTGLDVVNYKSL